MQGLGERDILGGITLRYQPQVNLQSGEIIGAEALLRCRSGNKDFPITVFIQAAEASGMIKEIGAMVIEKAFAQAVAWRSMGISLVVAINLSPLQASDPATLSVVDSALADSGADPNRIEFELTEGQMQVGGMPSVVCGMNALKSRGFRVAMDDFGVGHSSLERLADIPFDRIKVDRSFIAKAGYSKTHFAICLAVIDLADRIGTSVLAEGIEHEDQVEMLRNLGCLEAQGFLFGRPVVAEELTKRLLGEDTKIRRLCVAGAV